MDNTAHDDVIESNQTPSADTNDSKFFDAFTKPIKLYRYMAIRHRLRPIIVPQSLRYSQVANNQARKTKNFSIMTYIKDRTRLLARALALRIYSLNPSTVLLGDCVCRFNRVFVYVIPGMNVAEILDRSNRPPESKARMCDDDGLLFEEESRIPSNSRVYSYVPIGNLRPRGNLPPTVTLYVPFDGALWLLTRSADGSVEFGGIVKEITSLSDVHQKIQVQMRCTKKPDGSVIPDHILKVELRSTIMEMNNVFHSEADLLNCMRPNRKLDSISNVCGERNNIMAVAGNETTSNIRYVFEHQTISQTTVCRNVNTAAISCFLCDMQIDLKHLLLHLRTNHFRLKFDIIPGIDRSASRESFSTNISVKINSDFCGGCVTNLCKTTTSVDNGSLAGVFNFEWYANPDKDYSTESTPLTVIMDNDQVTIHRKKFEREVSQFRVCYTTLSTVPVPNQNVDSEDDDEPAMCWLRQFMNTRINDFSDVNDGEKAMMALWNHQVDKKRLLGDCAVNEVCSSLVKEYGDELRSRGLVYNCFLHMLNLRCYRLLTNSQLVVHTRVLLETIKAKPIM